MAQNVQLLIPCFVDQLFPQVGIDAVSVLERLGCRVHYPTTQTCCGQPPFNSGFYDEARQVAAYEMQQLGGDEPIVVPSGSCATMATKFYPELFENTEQHQQARDFSQRVWEFSSFLVDYLGVTDVGARLAGKATFHDGCHGLRELNIQQSPRILLQHVRELELVEMGEAETCCGFGGTFSVKFPEISTAMAQTKTLSAQEAGADYIVSNDPSCLMQIQGYAQRNGHGFDCLHLAQVLARQ